MRRMWVVFSALLTLPLWSPTPAAAERSTCTCYYGYDEECPKDFVCEGNFTGADKCIRMKGPGATRKEQKGGAWRKDGKGCTIQDGDGDGVVAACDGTCVKKKKGTKCALEPTDLVAQALNLWLEAMTLPGLAGGGPMDQSRVDQARALPIDPECTEYLGWRVMGVMELCRGNDVILHLDDHHEVLEDHAIADLRGNDCAVQSGNRCVEAITVGLTNRGAVAGIIDSIVEGCGGDLPFGNTGLDGFPPLEGVKLRIQDTVEFLTTPPVATAPPRVPFNRVRP